jgi:hypothetical protein
MDTCGEGKRLVHLLDDSVRANGYRTRIDVDPMQLWSHIVHIATHWTHTIGQMSSNKVMMIDQQSHSVISIIII